MTFAAEIQAFAQKAKANADDATREIVSGMITEVDGRSPVGMPDLWKTPPPPGYQPGLFRGNWQLGVDVMITSPIARIDPEGTAATSENLASIPANAFGHTYYLTNNVDYAWDLEYGSSWRQAPHGVVGLATLQFDRITGEAIAKVPV